MEIPILRDILVIFGAAIAVIVVSRRLGVPSIVGLFITGIITGPHGFGLVGKVHEVEIMAEVGVVLLLFTIGLEFSVKDLLRMRTFVLFGGTVQVALTTLAGAGLAMLFGRPASQGVFYGFLLALSSTAIVLKIVQERAETDAPHGRAILGILIFQDVIVVPMMLVTPVLAGSDGAPFLRLGLILGKGALVVAGTLLLARWLVPRILYQAAALRNREVFLLAIVFIGLAVAWLTQEAGLSLALGAFLAGLIISESEYSHQALADIMPFRDVFTSLFFVSIGMLLDLSVVIADPLIFLALAAGVLIVKAGLAGATGIGAGLPLRAAALSGLALSQVGEFSFILSRSGVEAGLMDNRSYQLFLGVAIITMVATPFIIKAGPRMADAVLKLPLPERLKRGAGPQGQQSYRTMKDHLVVIGFGPAGRHLAKAASATSIDHLVIEINAETVKREKSNGIPIIYGDATNRPVLEHAAITHARVLVVAIPDVPATRRIVDVARSMNPLLYIIARTPFIKEIEPLKRCGADEVIPTEFETSIEIFTRVLAKYLVPSEEIARFTNEVRAGGYTILRAENLKAPPVCDLREQMPGQEIVTVRMEEGCEAHGKTLADLALRKSHGVTMLALRRGEDATTNPGAEQDLRAGDVVVLFGAPEDMAKASALFKKPQAL